MANGFVRAKHRETGAVTELHESTLRYLPNWERVDGPPPNKPKPRVRLPRATEPAPSTTPTSAAPAVTDETKEHRS